MRLLHDGFTTYLSGVLYCKNCHSLRVIESSVRARRRTGLMCSAGSLTCPCVPARTQCRLNPRNSSFCVNPREVEREADAAMCHMNCAHLCGQHLSATSIFGVRTQPCKRMLDGPPQFLEANSRFTVQWISLTNACFRCP